MSYLNAGYDASMVLHQARMESVRASAAAAGLRQRNRTDSGVRRLARWAAAAARRAWKLRPPARRPRTTLQA